MHYRCAESYRNFRIGRNQIQKARPCFICPDLNYTFLNYPLNIRNCQEAHNSLFHIGAIEFATLQSS